MIEVHTHLNDAELIKDVSLRLIALLRQRNLNQPFRIALTGGTLGIALLARLKELDVTPNGIEFYWGDERWVGLQDVDRNEAQALSAWPSLARAELNRFESPDSTSLEDAAEAMNSNYQRLVDSGKFSGFDLVLLGVGPDGHVASLFPGHAPNQNRWVVFETDSPKPPSKRLSFSFEALNDAKRIWFLASGEAKANVVARAINHGENAGLPCGKVNGVLETRWFVDEVISKAIQKID